MQPIHYSLVLPNGLTLVAEQLDAVRSAAFNLLLPAGAVTDPPAALGSAGVLEGLCYRGAGGRSSREISDALDALGVQRSGGAELECTTFGAALLADDLPRALEIYADVVRRPHLDADQFAAEQTLALQRLERLEDSPSEKLFVHLRAAYFADPYGRTSLGTEEGLRALSPGTLREDHDRRYRPEGAILAVAGRFRWHELNETVHRLFGDWSGSAPVPPPPDTSGRPRYLHVPKETNQEQIGLLYPSVPVEHPDFYRSRLALRVLSGGMAARLFTEIREKEGLCYAVQAFPVTVRGAGAVGAYAGTTPERCEATLRLLLQVLRGMAEGVTLDELTRARTGVLSDLVLQCEATRARAAVIARDQFLLGRVRTLDEIRAAIEGITLDSLNDWLRRNPAGDWTVATLGPTELEVPD